MAGAFSGASGTTLLVWVDAETLRGPEMEGSQLDDKIKEMLEDACCLLGTRWGIEFTHHPHGGVLYAFGCQPRYPIGLQTALRALGDLSYHVRIHRGGAHDTVNQLIRYEECKRKYHVPETVHEDTSGEESRGNLTGPAWPRKRK